MGRTAEFWRFGVLPDVDIAEFGELAHYYESLGWDGFTLPTSVLPGTKLSRLPNRQGPVPLVPYHHPHAVIAVAVAQTRTLRIGTSTMPPSMHPDSIAAARWWSHRVSTSRESLWPEISAALLSPQPTPPEIQANRPA